MRKIGALFLILASHFAFSDAKCIWRHKGMSFSFCVGAKVYVPIAENQFRVARILDVRTESESILPAGPDAKNPYDKAIWISSGAVVLDPTCYRDICAGDRLVFFPAVNEPYVEGTSRVRFGRAKSVDQERRECTISFMGEGRRIEVTTRLVKDVSRSVDFLDLPPLAGQNPGRVKVNDQVQLRLSDRLENAKIIFLSSSGWGYVETQSESDLDLKKVTYHWHPFYVR